MRFWHRIVALLVALVFTSSTSLAAMPLVWCLGADGHRAIEYKTGNTHTDHQALAQRNLATESVIQSPSADRDDCQDLRLVDQTKTSSWAADHGLLTFDDRVAVPQFVTLPSLTELVQPKHRLPPDDTAPDPQRLALRSVVLLI